MILKNLLNKTFFAAVLFMFSVNVFALTSNKASTSVASSSFELNSLMTKIKMELQNPAQVILAQVAPMTAGAEAPSSSGINWLLIIVAILLVAVIGVVFDILEKTAQIQGKTLLNWSKINSILLMLFLVVGLIATVWEFYAHGKLTLFEQGAASEHGAIYDNMFMITLALTGVVFIITQILLFWYSYKYKYNSNRKALYYPDNHKLEYIWTIVPAIVLTVLVVRGLITWNKIMYQKDEKAINVEIFGYQFGWNVRYAGTDNKLGFHDFRTVGVINPLGVDTTDEKAFDDVVTNELHLPVGVPVHFHFRAKDVIHGAYFPHFRAQMNVVPGLPTQLEFIPTVTTADMRAKLNQPTFDYALLCNKICGSAHYRMKMKIVIESQAEYEKWMNEQPALVNKAAAPKVEEVATLTADTKKEDKKEVALN